MLEVKPKHVGGAHEKRFCAGVGIIKVCIVKDCKGECVILSIKKYLCLNMFKDEL
jgi:hypothetical protein